MAHSMKIKRVIDMAIRELDRWCGFKQDKTSPKGYSLHSSEEEIEEEIYRHNVLPLCATIPDIKEWLANNYDPTYEYCKERTLRIYKNWENREEKKFDDSECD